MADILISQLPITTVADGEDLLIIDSKQNSGTIVTHAIAVKHLIRDIQFEDGTAVSPSITFINDTNTGFYRVGDDTIGFTTSGINRMVIGPTGNVGIGTLTPTEKLTVSNGKISLQNGGNNELVLEARDGGAGVTQKGPLPLVFATDDVKRVAINETGAVLVNTEQVLTDAQVHIAGGSLVVNGGDFTGTTSGEVVIGYRATGYKQLLKLNIQGALANTLDEYGTAGQVLTSGGEGAPFTWTDGGTGGASEPFTNPGANPPTPEIYGQFWFNSDEDTLYIWDGQHWQEVGSGNMTHSGPNAPIDPDEGELWWDSTNNLLYGWDNTTDSWILIGPQDITDGVTPVITIGTTTTGAPGTDAIVTDTGVAPDVELNFTIPRGDEGESATVALGTVATGAEGTDVIITNSGPDEHNAVFNFTIPRGDKGEDGEPGTGIQLQGSFDYVGPPTQAPEVTDPQDGDLWIDSNGDGWAWDGNNWNNVGPIQGPAGDEGEAATITVGATTTGDAGTNASVINTGDVNDAVLEFTIPRGDKGEDGEAATVDVHSTETGLPGTDAIVTNEGTTSAAEFKFVIPRGDKGDDGDPQKVYVNDVAPSGAEEGDLWYETDTDTLKIYVDGAWVPVSSSGGGVSPSPIEPTDPEIGDLWLNTNNGNIYYWDGSSWVEIAKDDYVDLTSDQTIGGNKTFTEHITGSIDLATDCSRSVLAGAGLTGGGVLNADVTLAISLGDGLKITGTDPNEVVAVKAGDDTIIVDAQGVKANVADLFDPANLNAVISFNGRKGVVVPEDDDYSINQLSDVDTTSTGEGYVLTQVGTQWVPREISIPGALKLKGSIDATTEVGPADAEVGDFYVNTVTGNFLDDTSWGSLANTPVTEGDLIVKLEAENEWAIIGNFGGTVGGVESVTAQNGVVETGGDPLNPVLEADDTVVRTTGDFTLAGDITFGGEVTFNGTLTGDLNGNASGVTVSILAGDGLVGGGILTEDRTLSVNHDSTLQITNDELGVVLGAGGGLEIDPYGGIGIDPDFIVENSPEVNDGKIEFEVGTNSGISLSGDLASTANQADDTKLTIEVDTTVVRTMGDQTIGGIKTFTAQTLLDGGYIAAVESFVNADFNVTGDTTIGGNLDVTGDTTTNMISAVIFDIDSLDELPDEDPYGNP